MPPLSHSMEGGGKEEESYKHKLSRCANTDIVNNEADDEWEMKGWDWAQWTYLLLLRAAGGEEETHHINQSVKEYEKQIRKHLAPQRIWWSSTFSKSVSKLLPGLHFLFYDILAQLADRESIQ